MSNPSSPIIKFGIIGCANIAQKVSKAITLAPNATLYAIGSRSLEKATKFAADNGFTDSAKVYGSYEAVLDDPEVDAVYMPLPTSLHLKWAVLAARKKKHVILEKPVALNVGELDVILEACESNGVQIMDATMWTHHPATGKMKEFLLDSTRFGQLKSVDTRFTFAGSKDFLENDIRVKPEFDALGALGDVGWYCASSILWAADFALPKSLTAHRDAIFNDAGVIMTCGASLQWEDGKTATMHCSFLEEMALDINAVGTNGTLLFHNFEITMKVKDEILYSTSLFPVPGQEPKPKPSTDLPAEALLVMEFSRLVGRIKFDGAKPEKKWPMISRQNQLILDCVKASIDRGYETVEIKG